MPSAKFVNIRTSAEVKAQQGSSNNSSSNGSKNYYFNADGMPTPIRDEGYTDSPPQDYDYFFGGSNSISISNSCCSTGTRLDGKDASGTLVERNTAASTVKINEGNLSTTASMSHIRFAASSSPPRSAETPSLAEVRACITKTNRT